MNALTSYFRHLIVSGLLLVVERNHLPIAGAEEAAHAVALFLIGTGTWLVTKYAPIIARKWGLMLVLFFVGVFSLPSCTGVNPVPVEACYYDKHGRVCYGAEGLRVEVGSAK